MEALNPASQKTSGKTKKIIFQIIQEGSEKPKVNIAIPLKLAKSGMNFIPQNGKLHANFSDSDIDLSNVNWKEILEMAVAGETGELFYMEVEDNGKTLIIRVAVE